MTYEVKVTPAHLKALWAKTEWADPFDGYFGNTDKMWEYLYMSEQCPQVLKQEFPTVECGNEDANEILNQMNNYWRGALIDKYISKHNKEVHEGFNVYWWSTHDLADYSE